MAATDNQRKLLIGAGIVIALLMALIAFLIYGKMGDGRTIEEQKKELSEAARLQRELEDEYDSAMAELDEILEENEGLRATVEEQKAELERQKNRIASALSKGDANQADLDAARGEITRLKAQQQAFLTKIDELEKTNSLLSNEIVQVKEEKKMVEEEVVRTKRTSEEALAAKDAVIQGVTMEKEDLEKEKAYLENKVNIASVVKVDGISVGSYKLKSKGKMVKKRYAKNVDVLKICYTAKENRIVAPGMEQFIIRVVTPLGETMYDESLGSGKFANKDNHEETLFSKAQDVPYDNEDTEQCLNWKPEMPFSKGNYMLEIYNKGYKVGETEFRLK